MARYTFVCPDETCSYKHGFSMNFEPKESEDKTCDLCMQKLKVVDAATVNPPATKTPGLLSGVGDINKRLSGDFRDMLQAIKKGSPGSTMRDYK